MCDGVLLNSDNRLIDITIIILETAYLLLYNTSVN